MAALPSAFFAHVSIAWCSVWPRYWMAKSTIDVVPPKAAAIVPDSKSSADVVPPNGMSRWVCTSMPPGSTSLPVASITRSAGRSSAVPIVVIRSPSTKTSPVIEIGRGDDRPALDEDAHVRSSLPARVSAATRPASRIAAARATAAAAG